MELRCKLLGIHGKIETNVKLLRETLPTYVFHEGRIFQYYERTTYIEMGRIQDHSIV